jgi:antitoxin ParD1/3/4
MNISLPNKHKPQKRLETLLLEGLDSGAATPMTDQDWEDIRKAVRERFAKPRTL